jgi:subfamily B ATP-binding cassette protein MsbA
MMKEIRAIKKLTPLFKIYPWAVPSITILGVLSSLSEGIGISMLAPFLQSLNNTNNNPIIVDNQFLKIIQNIFSFVPSTNRPMIILAMMVLIIGFKAILSYSQKILSFWWSTNINHKLSCQIMEKIMLVDYGFFDQNSSGNMMNILSSHTGKVAEALLYMSRIIINVSTLLVFGFILLLISWPMTVGVLIALFLVSKVIRLIAYPMKKLGEENIKIGSRLYNLIFGIFYGMKTVRSFGQEAYEQKRFRFASRQMVQNQVKMEMLSASIEPIFEFLSVIILVSILGISIKTNISIPTMLAFIFMLYRLQPQVGQLDGNRIRLMSLQKAVQELFDFIQYAEEHDTKSGDVYLEHLSKGLQFQDVAFRYNPKENNIIQDFSLYIPQGKTTAFVGSSGAGKTTIINLICRFYNVTEGNIYVDGHLIQDLQLKQWRKHIALVSQNIHIFSASVRDNIAYGRVDATLEEVIEAANLANADEFIQQLPNGYDTIIGDEGIGLSGGQQQRIALARAILKNAEIFILDEATNALDSISEHLIQEAIKKFGSTRTVIIIAHRLSTIEHADQIVVMDKGRIIEQGNIQELLKRNGLFSKLYKTQSMKSFSP